METNTRIYQVMIKTKLQYSNLVNIKRLGGGNIQLKFMVAQMQFNCVYQYTAGNRSLILSIYFIYQRKIRENLDIKPTENILVTEHRDKV